MTILIVTAHPSSHGFTHKIAKTPEIKFSSNSNKKIEAVINPIEIFLKI